MPPQAPSASAAPLGRHRGGEDRQRQRRHDRAADALQARGRRRARSIDGASAAAADASGEDREPDREHPPAAEAVAERRAGQEQHGEGERVRVDRPLEAARCVACRSCADHRQRRRDDEVVERDHEERDRGDRERPERWLIDVSSSVTACELSLLRCEKKRRLRAPCRSPRAAAAPTAPVVAEQLHRRRARSAASRWRRSCETSAAGRRPRRARRRSTRSPKPRADDRADLRVVAGRVGLHLRPQPAGRLDEHARRRPRRSPCSASSPRLPSAARWNDLERLAEAARDDGDEELLLRPEEPEDVRLRDAGPPGDLLGRGAVQARARRTRRAPRRGSPRGAPRRSVALPSTTMRVS